MSTLILEHPHSGIIKQAPVGYSWTTLLFPTLPALFRGDFKGFVIRLLLDCLLLPILIFGFGKRRRISQRSYTTPHAFRPRRSSLRIFWLL